MRERIAKKLWEVARDYASLSMFVKPWEETKAEVKEFYYKQVDAIMPEIINADGNEKDKGGELMDDRIAAIVVGFASVALGVFLVATLVLGVQWGQKTFFDNVPSTVWVDDKLVYQGTSAGFDVDSSGANTTVTIYGGWLYLFPERYYVSKSVKIEGKK
ncbi:MAG: hypothetical protein WC552_09885 [Candidatus Omnitrophota bacterium]